MSLPEGAVIQESELKKITDAQAALAADHHAPRQVSVTVNISVHHAYPKVLYKGEGTAKAIKVNSADEEKAAREEGWGDHTPESAKEE